MTVVFLSMSDETTRSAGDPLLSPTAAAARLKAAGLAVSDETLRRWARTHQIDAVQLPFGRVKFRQSVIDALVTPRSVVPA